MPKVGITLNNMPELPEVETVKNILLPKVINKTIDNVVIFYDRLITSDIEEFKANFLNKTILDIKRYGKYLFFILSEDYVLITHLRMEGKFFYHEKNENIRKKSTSLIFEFKDNTYLCFDDTRKFGLMHLTKKDEIKELKMIKKLGIEANNVPESEYQNLIKKFKKNKNIKELLLDQSILTGIGNIYADETLYLSKVNPLTKGKDLSDEKIIEIIKNSKIILDKAIKLGGSTIHSFNASGIDGKFQNSLLCYGKEGEICPECGTKFHKIFVGGRGTTFCPNCQIDNSLKKAIGITGGIASGKTSVLKHLAEKGYLVINSDSIIKNLYLEESVRRKASKIYGFDFYVDKKEDRLKAKEILNKNPDKKLKIEALLYPLLEERLLKYIKDNDEIIIEVPLLFKAHYEYMFKKIIVLLASKERQTENLISRGEKNIDESLKINKDFTYNENNKDICIVTNDGTLKELFNKVDEIIK